MSTAKDDVPSPIDFHNPQEARAWVADTVARRPYRATFFACFAHALNAHGRAEPLRILELGSGPGHLANHILENCGVSHYAALDFSDAMHDIAREKWNAFADRVTTLTRDFRRADWADGLAGFDAVVTMQAAHETRHKRHLPGLLSLARGTLREGGLFLYADHYAEAGSDKNEALYLARDEQAGALAQAGLKDIDCLLVEGGMALYRGTSVSCRD